MKYEEIQEMLDRYWEGETTLEEERSIKAYFKSGNIDQRFQAIAPMFQAIQEEQSIQLTAKAKAIPMRPQMYQWAAAASVALLLAAGWWMLSPEKPVAPLAEKAPEALNKIIETPAVETPQKSMATVGNVISTHKVPHTPGPKKNQGKRIKPQPQIDPETLQAMAEIKAALALVSSKLDKGKTEAVRGASLLENIDKIPKRKAG